MLSGIICDRVIRRSAPFFSTKAQGEGTGLGLSMVHGLAAQSGGVLRITSAAGSGTRVDMLLPETHKEVQATTPATTASNVVECSRVRILLVDDEELVRHATASLLIDLGHGVAQAASGYLALDMIRADFAFDLLVTDYLMPGMDGAELIDKARSCVQIYRCY